jgi:hypothetical protein
MSEQLQSLPRPVLIAIVGGVAALALLFISRRGAQEEPVPAAPPAEQVAPTDGAAGSQSGTQSKSGTQSQGKSQGTVEPGGLEARTLPPAVKNALDAKKVVVVMIYNPKSSDDISVRNDVESISTRGGKVATFTDNFDNVARYTRLTGTQTITQTPTVVVIDAQGNGRMATGFRDQETVDQLVVDALN